MINFYIDEVNFKYPHGFKTKCRIWLINSAKNENYKISNLNIIVTSDSKLLQINNDFLDHDYYTDIITFNYNSGNVINGELYISSDRVLDNANLNEIDFYVEFKRVIIHGLLHLMNYNDHTETEISEMRSKENYYLNLF